MRVATGAGFVEVADRVWVSRYEWVDANVTAVGSSRGVLLVDTHGSAAAGDRVLDDLRRAGLGSVVHVANTHWHWDHTFGNSAFRRAVPKAPIHAHEEAARWLAEHGESIKQRYADDPDDPHRDEVMATDIALPDRTFAYTQMLDLGDRLVELTYLGRGHTSGDIIVRVPDADVLLAGDLVEESAKPWIGRDSWPLEWPATLDAMLSVMGEGSTVIPGHGDPVDRQLVVAQCNELAEIARLVRSLVDAGVPAEHAVAAAEWPWDADDRIRNAVARGYDALSA